MTFSPCLQTPLHLAVLTDQPGAIILLIRAGANPTLPDRNGRTPAHLAVKYGKNECLAALLHYLRKGCSVEEPFPELNMRCYDGENHSLDRGILLFIKEYIHVLAKTLLCFSKN